MPEYLSPGVYVEEIDAGPRPIAGVSTSTAGLVGVTRRGPVSGKPRLVTNFLEFQSLFGGFLPAPDDTIAAQWRGNATEGGQWWTFPLSVKGFFDNGGQRVYVKRVVSKDAVAATTAALIRSGRTTEVTRNAAPGATELQVRHLFGFTGEDDVTVHDGSTGRPIHTGKIKGYASGNEITVTVDPALAEGVRADRGDFVRTGALTDNPLVFAASSGGDWGNALRVRVRPMAGAQFPLLPDPGQGDTFITTLRTAAVAADTVLKVADAPGLTGLTGTFWVRIGATRHAATLGTPDGGPTLNLAAAIGRDVDAGTTVQRVRQSNPDSNAKAVRLGGGSRLYPGALVQFDGGTKLSRNTVDRVDGDLVTFDDPLGASFFEGQRAQVVEAEVQVSMDDGGDVADETFTNLRWDPDDPLGIVRVLGVRSQLVTATATGPVLTGSGFPVAERGWAPLTGGDDKAGDLRPADFVGADGGSGLRTGIAALEDIDDVAICAVPGVWSGTVQQALIGHCEQLKDRFAVLDPQDGLGIDAIQDFRAPYDTRYAALYYPWVAAPHPVSGERTNLPPSGHMLGVYARTDVERGVHKAPANAIIRGIDLRNGLTEDITRREQDTLNPKGINALRYFPGMGNRVWGARTLSSDSSWKYVNVRRLFLFLEESIDEGTQWVVFEPNSEPLWALVKQTVENFLGSVWRSGALAGTTAEEAYFVACDRTTMTQDDQDNGRLICVIGVAPVFPAEFVVFRIQQMTRETQAA